MWLESITTANHEFLERIRPEHLRTARAPGPAIITCMDPRVNLAAIGVPGFSADGANDSTIRIITQLGLLERFHQTMKTEEIYWHLYQSPAEARERLAEFRERYNTIRPHWALRPEGGGDPLTPHDVYVHHRATTLPAWQTWARAARAKLDAMIDNAHAPQPTTPLAA